LGLFVAYSLRIDSLQQFLSYLEAMEAMIKYLLEMYDLTEAGDII